MKKIVIDARESGTSTGRYIDKMVEYLHQLPLEYEIHLLAKPHRIDFFKSVAPNFTVHECTFSEFSFGEQWGMWRQVAALKADLVHFPIVQQPILYRGKVVTSMLDLTTTRFRNPTKNPVVFWTKQQVYKFVNQVVARKSKHIITISEFVRQDLVDYTHVSADKITVTYPAADIITEKSEPFSPADGKRYIMYVGRPQPHKNLRRLIESFQILSKQDPELYLVLAGKKDAAYEQLAQYTQEQGVQERSIFTDFISDGQLRWLYEHAQAYVFPSLSEGFGLPGLEAMQYGLPVVSSNATCLPEIYGDAAQYFDPTNVPEMAATIQTVLSDKELRDNLSKKGHEQVKKYSWERMAHQTLEVYESVLER